MKREALLLYAVTDRRWAKRKSLYEQVEEALSGGVTIVQLREKALSEHEFLKEAIELKRLCTRYGAPLIINDNIDIARKSGADGIHIGQGDLAITDARKMLGESGILGVSAHNVQEAVYAEACGADYLGVGAAFVTDTKGDAIPISHDVYREITGAVSIPTVAIGGITRENICKLKHTGIDGVALVSAIFASKSIKEECMYFRKITSEIIRKEGE